MEIIGEGPGAITARARLTLAGNHLEMVGTHLLYGRPVHPLTISLSSQNARKLAETGHDGQWVLRSSEQMEDGQHRMEIEPARPDEMIPDPRDEAGAGQFRANPGQFGWTDGRFGRIPPDTEEDAGQNPERNT